MIDEHGNRHIDILRDWQYILGHRQFSIDIQSADGKQIQVDLSMEASLILVSEMLQMHDVAWRDGRPIDARDNEVRPEWVMSVNERRYLFNRRK